MTRGFDGGQAAFELPRNDNDDSIGVWRWGERESSAGNVSLRGSARWPPMRCIQSAPAHAVEALCISARRLPDRRSSSRSPTSRLTTYSAFPGFKRKQQRVDGPRDPSVGTRVRHRGISFGRPSACCFSRKAAVRPVAGGLATWLFELRAVAEVELLWRQHIAPIELGREGRRVVLDFDLEPGLAEAAGEVEPV